MSAASYTTGSTNPGFVKQGAVKEDAHTRALNSFRREQQRRGQAEDDEDDDDEEGRSDDDDDEDPY